MGRALRRLGIGCGGLLVVLVLLVVLIAAFSHTGKKPPSTSTGSWPVSYRTSQIRACSSPPAALSATLCTCMSNYLEKRVDYRQMVGQTTEARRVKKAAGRYCVFGTPAKPASAGATLTRSSGSRLAADGAAWETGLHAYLTAAPRCFAESSAAFVGCLGAAFARWSTPFERAKAHVRTDAETVTDRCRSRLLDYLGSGGAGDALLETMRFAQKDARERNLTLVSQTLDGLAIPAFKTTDSALRAAESAC